MIRVEICEEPLIKNMSATQAGGDRTSKKIRWSSGEYSGFILLISNYLEDGEKCFFDDVHRVQNITELKKPNAKYSCIIIPYGNYKAAGSMYTFRDVAMYPKKLSVFPYNASLSEQIIYTGKGDSCLYLPVSIGYSIKSKKRLFSLKGEYKEVKIIGAKCSNGVLFYRVSGSNAVYPITTDMMNGFSVNTNNSMLTVGVNKKYKDCYVLSEV